MPATMTGEKDHPRRTEPASNKSIGRRSEGGFHRHFLDFGQPFDLIETTSTYNTDHRFLHNKMSSL